MQNKLVSMVMSCGAGMFLVSEMYFMTGVFVLCALYASEGLLFE